MAPQKIILGRCKDDKKVPQFHRGRSMMVA
jgi:hypothetical protein